MKVGTSVEKKKCCYSPCPLPDGVGASDANEEVGEGSAAVAQDPKRFCSRNAIHSVTYVWDSFFDSNSASGSQSNLKFKAGKHETST